MASKASYKPVHVFGQSIAEPLSDALVVVAMWRIQEVEAPKCSSHLLQSGKYVGGKQRHVLHSRAGILLQVSLNLALPLRPESWLDIDEPTT